METFKIENRKITYNYRSEKGVVDVENIKKIIVETESQHQTDIKKIKSKGLIFLGVGLILFILGFISMNLFFGAFGIIGVGLFMFSQFSISKINKRLNEYFNNPKVEAIIVIERNQSKLNTVTESYVHDSCVIYGGSNDDCGLRKGQLEKELFSV